MVRFRSGLGILLLPFLLGACDGAALISAVSNRPPQTPQEVPFKGACTTELGAPVPVMGSGQLIGFDLFAEGTCELTHLGHSRVEVVTYLRFADCDPVANTCTTTGPVTFTAADGSKLFTSGRSTDTPANVPPVFSFTSTGTILGGTGRFGNASGTLDTDVFVDQAAGQASFAYDGVFTF